MKKYRLIKNNTLTNTIKSSNYKPSKFVKGVFIIPIVNVVLGTITLFCKVDVDALHVNEVFGSINAFALSTTTYVCIKSIKSYFDLKKLFKLSNNLIENGVFISMESMENSDIIEDDNVSLIKVSECDNIIQTSYDDGVAYHYCDNENNISDITGIVNRSILRKKKINNTRRNGKH